MIKSYLAAPTRETTAYPALLQKASSDHVSPRLPLTLVQPLTHSANVPKAYQADPSGGEHTRREQHNCQRACPILTPTGASRRLKLFRLRFSTKLCTCAERPFKVSHPPQPTFSATTIPLLKVQNINPSSPLSDVVCLGRRIYTLATFFDTRMTPVN